MHKRLVLVGCGNMGFAMLSGWLRTGTLKPDEVVVVEPGEARTSTCANFWKSTCSRSWTEGGAMNADTYSFAERKGAPGGALFLTFHGTGGDEHQFAGLAAQLMPAATVVSPRGDVSEYGASRFFRRTGEGVYDMADLALRTEKMRGFVSGLKAQHSPSRVIGLGYSNGANILASVLFGEAGLFDDVVLMHPLIPFEPPDNPALAAARVLITAGRNDPICPPSQTERLGDYFRRQGAELRLQWHDGGHGIEPVEIAAIRDFLARDRAPAD